METNQKPSSGIEQDFPGSPHLAEASEANLLWDEYKYRHDLVWRHLIRSTLALVGLVTVRYSSAFNPTVLLVLIAWMVALGYWLITLLAIEPELRLLSKVRRTHRIRQNKYFQLSHPIEEIIGPDPWGKIFFVDKFSRRVGIYLLLLLVGTFYAGIIALIDPGPVISMI